MNGILQVNQDGVTGTAATVSALASFSDQLTTLHTQEVHILYSTLLNNCALAICLSTYMSVCFSAWLHFCLSACLPVLISVLSVFLAAVVSICLTLSNPIYRSTSLHWPEPALLSCRSVPGNWYVPSSALRSSSSKPFWTTEGNHTPNRRKYS